jgi:hypothetical protein
MENPTLHRGHLFILYFDSLYETEDQRNPERPISLYVLAGSITEAIQKANYIYPDEVVHSAGHEGNHDIPGYGKTDVKVII